MKKSKYHRVTAENNKWSNEYLIGRYEFEHDFVWYRQVRTFNERKQHAGAIADGHKVRGRRRKLPTNWDDQKLSFAWGKCWKRFTRRKKQYHPVVF